jgi:TRAP-type C4-dicarboxylate transport system permease small subunit
MEVHDRNAIEFGTFGRRLFSLSKVFAIVGGLAMVAIVALAIVSIVGRKLAATPVTGDVEIMQFIAAPAIACFFAYCHLIDGDVRVDFVSDHLPPGFQRALKIAGSALLGLVAVLLAWRTAVGAVSLFEAGETSALLSWRIWISQALVVPGFALQAVAGLYMAFYYVTAAKKGAR